MDESNIDFRAIVDTSFDGVAIVDRGFVSYANRGLLAISGYSLDEVIGRPILDFVAHESRAAVRDRLRSGEEGRFEVLGVRKDGARVLLEACTRAQVIQGRPVRVTVFRDITARRQLEERLRQIDTLQAIGELASGVAHDFNNLLMVIRGHTDFLQEYAAADCSLRPHVDAIREAADGSKTLVRQLFALKRQETQPLQPLGLSTAVQSVSRIVQALVGSGIEVVMRLAEDLQPIRANPIHIQQIVMNLAINARDAMPDGGTLTVETAHAVTEQGAYALLRVSDTGHGMSEETRHRIFEPFFTTKEDQGGTGLGLVTVRRIVQDSGGFVSVDSEIGRGSVFSVYLPLLGDD